MIEQDVRILEEPRRHDERRRYPQEPGMRGNAENEGEYDDQGGRAASGGAEEVGENFQSKVFRKYVLLVGF